ncbi:MAG: hypothetical protein SFZ03_04715 [Candidatus Melainabacteria bacterium]|nr:hypothetical protein [Candidatus Melainabacteria bacterium]
MSLSHYRWMECLWMPYRTKVAQGQAAVVVMAVTLLMGLIIMGLSINQLQYVNARRNVTSNDSLQAYYVAQAGVQEALAARMDPRTNYLNFVSSPQGPKYPLSGRVYQNPSNLTGLLGAYRYIVLGGDNARDPVSGNYWNDSNSLLNPLSQQPFYIISRGSVCQAANGQTLVNAIVPGMVPTCTSGQLQHTTVVATVDMSRNSNAARDLVSDYRPVTGNNDVVLPAPVMVPGGGLSNTVNFESAWSAVQSDAVPLLAVVHLLSEPRNIRVYNINSTTFTIPDRVQPNAVIRLYFRGGLDIRSPYKYNETACKNDPNECYLRIQKMNPDFTPELQGNKPVYFNGATIIPLLPSGAELIVFPPSGNNMSVGTNYQIVLDPNLSDTRGKTLGAAYNIRFTVGT